MSLLMMHPRVPRKVPPPPPPPTSAQWLQRTFTLNADGYYGLDASSAQPEISPGGVLTTQVFTPASAAVAAAVAAGRQPTSNYSIIIVVPPDGIKGWDGLTQMADTIPALLGWGGTPSATHETIVIFPQRPTHWTGTGGTDGNSRGRRAMFNIIDATLALVQAEFSCDANRVYMTGWSGGGFIALQYIYQRVNRGLPRNIAALVTASASFGYNLVEAVPSLTISPPTEAQAATVEAPNIVSSNVPWWEFNSLGDQIVSTGWYSNTQTALAALGVTYPTARYKFTEYTTESHTQTPTSMTGTFNMTQDPWADMLTKHL